MVAWLLGVAMLALNLGPVTDPGVSLQWVPPPTAGVRLPAMAETATDRVLVRKPWCDFGRHAQRFSKGFTGVDLVFRKPSVPARNALNAIRDSILNPQSWSSPGLAEKEFARLAATSDGPALIRLTLVDTDARIQLLGLTASLPVVAKHPRLAAFATAYLGAPDAKLAQAAVEMHFASGCDTAALYALDGFRHGDERVQLTTLRLIYEASRNHENLRLIDRIGEFISQGKGSPRARVVALRVIGQLGTESVSNYVEKLLTDKQDAVAAEALVTLAILQPGKVEKRLQKWLSDKSALKRAAAIRAFAQVHANRRDLAEKYLRPLQNDTTPVPDFFGIRMAPDQQIGEIARSALRYIEL